MTLNIKSIFILTFSFLSIYSFANHQLPNADEEPVKLENPISVAYIQKNLRKESPRLVLTPAIEKNLKKKLKSDPVVKNFYAVLVEKVDSIQSEPLLERIVTGRRLLDVSREMLYRMNVLGLVYRIDRNTEVLQRIDEELQAVCNFEDWNPSHYLDVAEMATAVALAIDWAGEDLPAETVELAKSALIEKGIQPSFSEEDLPGWVNGTNNWNQVCNGGMIAASIAIAEKDPELAAKTISRALEGMPYALAEYAPAGVYPEGATYWVYGTSFTALTSSMLESAFGTDFGIANYPAFKESADFKLLSTAPSGWYYNYADCGDYRSENGDITLAWFASRTGNSNYYEKERFLQDPGKTIDISRLSGAGLVWLSQFEEKGEYALPLDWKGDGANPIVIFRGGDDDPRQFYFGGKGGKANLSHGNMDAGSFIFELDGVRWVVDPGNQPYHELEKTGFDLWGMCQECERWTLLTKNNYGHSTLTINDTLFKVAGFAPITDYQSGDQPAFTLDLTDVYGGKVKKVTRKFVKENDHALLIEDQFNLTDSVNTITWQLMTTADVEILEDGAMLKQDGKQLKLENLSHPELTVSIISLDPPPSLLDRAIDNLKRIEIRIPAYMMNNEGGTLRVRLSGE